MRTRIRHTAVLVLGFVLLALVMACGDSQPTRDIEATVEAMVELAKAAPTIPAPAPTRKPDLSTATAEPSPTSTPVPPTTTPTPTAIPTPDIEATGSS